MGGRHETPSKTITFALLWGFTKWDLEPLRTLLDRFVGAFGMYELRVIGVWVVHRPSVRLLPCCSFVPPPSLVRPYPSISQDCGEPSSQLEATKTIVSNFNGQLKYWILRGLLDIWKFFPDIIWWVLLNVMSFLFACAAHFWKSFLYFFTFLYIIFRTFVLGYSFRIFRFRFILSIQDRKVEDL